ncbi:hypothetical protein [Brevundimonas sp. A19_0]|uniref:hypothetical protein n=1 Tax=Brevundimonas sp. A19_0 TaxID=2821087 RepID=UPI001ADA115E|nr:hypothetical protein [Brevundimonas sp. A19_0]MBO9502900.1 hypothetical protein [Brevundimonas sp. A19_0]
MKVRSLALVSGLALAVSGCADDSTLMGTAPDGSPIYGRGFAPTSEDGTVTLNCAVGDLGELVNCRVVSEQPEGQGLGEIALASVTKSGRQAARIAAPAGTRIEFTVRLRDD